MSTQAMRALKEANRVRCHRAEVKRRMKAGEMSVAEAIEDPVVVSFNLHHRTGITLGQLLTFQRRWGPEKAARFCERVRYAPDTLLAELSSYQRRRIASLLT